MNFIWRAYCKFCDYTEREKSSLKWLDDFFLVDHCPKCGEARPWLKEFGSWVDVQVRVWFDPRTWPCRWVWQKKDDE